MIHCANFDSLCRHLEGHERPPAQAAQCSNGNIIQTPGPSFVCSWNFAPALTVCCIRSADLCRVYRGHRAVTLWPGGHWGQLSEHGGEAKYQVPSSGWLGGKCIIFVRFTSYFLQGCENNLVICWQKVRPNPLLFVPWLSLDATPTITADGELGAGRMSEAERILDTTMHHPSAGDFCIIWTRV